MTLRPAAFPPLACTVRGCGLPLHREGRAVVCAHGHGFDVARRGYINLLQPQDRRSRQAGDASRAVAARARLFGRGIGTALVSTLVDQIGALPLSEDAVIADIGCGSGELPAALAERCQVRAVGIDLSRDAIDHASRHTAPVTWVIANADRGLPLLDRSVAAITSVNARRHPAECARVLAPGGHLIVAVPAAADLQELRERLHGEATARDRIEAVVAEHAAFFAPQHRFTVRSQHVLDREALLDLLAGTYRGARTSAATEVAALDTLSVTLATDVVLFSSAERVRT